MCHSPKKKSSEKVFSLHVPAREVNYSLCKSRDVFSAYNCKLSPKRSSEGGRGRDGDLSSVYFSPFVNNGDVNCGRFDRAFERAVTTVTFTRDVSRSLRLPPFMTLSWMGHPAESKKRGKREWYKVIWINPWFASSELSFEGGPGCRAVSLSLRSNELLRETGYAKETL